MLILLPLGAFLLLWVLLYRSATPDRSVRISFLCACLLWGLLVVVNSEFFSRFHVLTRPAVALFWLSVCVLCGVALAKTSDPDMSRPPKTKHLKTDDALVLCTVIIVILTGLTALVAPPNTWDSMTYHMSRVAHWVQNRSVEFFPTSMPRELWASPWAEYAIAQLQILTQSDRWANIVQWWSMGASLIGVSLIAKMLGAARRGQLLSALIVATLPVGILESSSTQNDYAVACWLVCFVAFSLKLLKDARPVTAFFWALALGLGMLTKTTALTFSAPFLIWMTVAGLRKHGRAFLTTLLLLGVALAINAPQYARNYSLGGNIFSLTSESQSVPNTTHSIQGLASNAIRYAGSNLAVSYDPFNKGVVKAVEWTHNRMNWDVVDTRYTLGENYYVRFSRHEDNSSNTLTFVIFAAAAMLFFYQRQINRTTLLYFLSLMTAFLLFCLMLKWQPWGNRLLLPLAVLSAPFIAIVFDKQRPSIGIVTAIALVVTCIPWVLKNTSRSIISKDDSIFSRKRDEQYFNNVPGMYFSYRRAIDESINGGCTQIGLAMTTESWEYPLWALAGAPRNKNLRIEHVNVDNPSKKYAYPRGEFNPCVVIADGDNTQKLKVEVNGESFVKTNQWGYLSLLRKDINGSIAVLVRNAHLNGLFATSRDADELLAFAKDGLTPQLAGKIFMTRKEALDHAKQLDLAELNALYNGFGDTVGNLFMQGTELFLKGMGQNDPALMNKGQELLNAWDIWLRRNIDKLQTLVR